jgi:very-short-patch-repair endonuclease
MVITNKLKKIKREINILKDLVLLRFENKFVFRDQDYITEEIRKIFNRAEKLTTPAGDKVL